MYDHRKQIRWASLKVGIVLTSALLVLILTIMFAGSIERLISPRETIYAVFDDVRGLREGAPVWFSGIEIGSVREMDFTPDQKIRVSLSISPDSLNYLKEDSVATVLTLGLLGDKYIELSPGTKGTSRLKPGATLTGKAMMEFQDIVETSQKSIGRISDFIAMLEELLTTIEQGEGTVSRFLKDPAVYENLRKTTEDLATITKKIKSGKGNLGKMVGEEDLYTDIRSSVRDIKTFAASLQGSEGTVQKIVKDPELYNRFLSATTSLERFSKKLETSKGTVSLLLEDESLYRNLASLTKKFDLILGRIEKGEGTMGALLKEEALAEELKKTISELGALIRDIKEHPKKYFKFSLF